MAIIINDFEIVVEPPQQAGDEAGQHAPQGQQAPRVPPRDMQILMDWQKQRQQRVQAY